MAINIMRREIMCGVIALTATTLCIAAETEAECPAPAIVAEQNADAESIFKLEMSARADWQLVGYDGRTDDSQTGFRGKYLMTRIDGKIVKGLTYSWRQRFNKFSSDASFFDATDWIYLDYQISGFDLSAGKQVVNIGGWEYDRHPIDIMAASVFWNNINCYQFGVSAGYKFKSGDKLTFQVTESPFWTKSNRNMYAYNLMWTAKHGCFSPIYSLNMVEYAKGRYISYIALGNRFDLGPVEIEFDFMNRANGHGTYFFKDVSLMGDVAWNFAPRWAVRGKITYDVNKSGQDCDMLVYNGTELTMAGGDIEFYPLLKKRHSLRLHAGCWYSWGTNTNTADMMQSKTLFVSAGLTWHGDLLNIKCK